MRAIYYKGGITQLQYFSFSDGKIKMALAFFKQRLFIKYMLSNVEWERNETQSLLQEQLLYVMLRFISALLSVLLLNVCCFHVSCIPIQFYKLFVSSQIHHEMMLLCYSQSFIFCFPLPTGWRMHAPSWYRLLQCLKPTRIPFPPGITSLMVPGASFLGPLTSSWPLMRLRSASFEFSFQKHMESDHSTLY